MQISPTMLLRFGEKEYLANAMKQDVGYLDQFEPDIFWEKHGRKIIYLVAAVLAIGVVVFFWQKNAAQEEQTAGQRFAAARDTGAFESIIRDYAGKNVAADAMIRLGDIYFQNGKYNEAAIVYQKLFTEYPTYPLVPSARLGLAAVQEALGNFQAAGEQYQQLGSDPSGYTTFAARMGAARCAEALGQTKAARQMYEEIVAGMQGSPLAFEAYVRYQVLSRDLTKELPAQASNALTLPELPETPAATSSAAPPASMPLGK